MKKEKFKYTIDGVHGESETAIVTETTLRQVGKVPSDYSIYLEVKGPGDDELIEGEVDLSEPGRERFYSAKPNTNNG